MIRSGYPTLLYIKPSRLPKLLSLTIHTHALDGVGRVLHAYDHDGVERQVGLLVDWLDIELVVWHIYVQIGCVVERGLIDSLV